MIPDARVPEGPLSEKWTQCRADLSLVAPANRRKYRLIVVGSGLAGASTAASLGELGYPVDCFCFQDSPRRAHSVAAQGGINAAKNYQNDGDSIERLFHDTIKGGDFRSREANVWRLAEVSNEIIDQAVSQGVPFAREYGGLLDNRSFGGAQVSRTFYARGQTGQQLLLGCYGALQRQVASGRVRMFPRTEMLDLVLVDGVARGIVTRDLVTGEIRRWPAAAVILATGGYTNAYYLSTNAAGSNVTATWRAHRRGALMANPSFTQIHPTCIPPSGEHQAKLTLMSESLRNDGRIWVPKAPGDDRAPLDIPPEDRDYYLERMYPAYGNLGPRDIVSRAAKRVCDEGRGIGALGRGVYLDFADPIQDLGRKTIEERYGNLFEMYERITGDDPWTTPMRIFPAPHYAMGGLWVDYHLMSNIPGLFVIGEANFSDHGANRLGASALMQGLADGYFIVPLTVGDYLAQVRPEPIDADSEAFHEVEQEVQERIEALISSKGTRSVDSFHRELGQILWDECGMLRTADGLESALESIQALQASWRNDLRVTGESDELNRALERAGRVADFLELGELMCRDALAREESCGVHFREEHQTPDGEAQRDDGQFAHVATWSWRGEDEAPEREQEELAFEYEKPSARSYK